MIHSKVFATALAVAAFPVAAFAQVTPMPANTTPMVVGAPSANVLRTGTPVNLTLSEELTTKGKKLRVGHRFRMEVAEAVSVDGQVVIPAGSPALGEVTEVRNKGMWGKSGHLSARVLYVTVGGRQIRLSGAFDDKGVTGTAGVVAAVAFVPIAGFFTTGTSAVVPVGAPIKAFVDEDVALAFTSEAPKPMVVPAAATVPTPQN